MRLCRAGLAALSLCPSSVCSRGALPRESALRRNELIAALADEACIAYAASGGYTERIVDWLKSSCVSPFGRMLINHEVQRSQQCCMERFVRYMRDVLPNDSFIAFTETPIGHNENFENRNRLPNAGVDMND